MSTGQSDERGSAILEFLIIGLLVLVPLLYVVLTIMRVESAVMASTQAVREAGRAFVMSDSPQEGLRSAETAARVALRDQGFELPASALSITCSATCLAPSSSAHLHLQWRVDLPWLPAAVDGGPGYPITADSELRADTYRSEGSAP